MSETAKTLKIHGRTRLSGTVRVHGNKNSALPCMAASLLLGRIGKSITLTNVPDIADVRVLVNILGHLGVTGTRERSGTLRLTRTSLPRLVAVPPGIIALIRGSIILLGPLAGMHRRMDLPKPGGDRIGTRPITAHLTAMADLGVSIRDDNGILRVRANPRRKIPRRMKVWLTEQSVTATEIVLLYSAFLATTLTIADAACEPHIVTLCGLLEHMGARIRGTGSNLLTISWPGGVREPRTPFRLDDDFMEAATFAVAAAVTRSNVDIAYRSPADLELIDRYLRWMGVRTSVDTAKDLWRIRGASSTLKLHPMLRVIKAEPWPRFHTDIMSLFVVLATQCSGTLKFIEYMYDDRFGFVQALNDMGAMITIQGPHVISVSGTTQLAGNEMLLRPDIRSGAAMLLAALAAEGTSVLHDRKGVIMRGYQELPEKLRSLGADIQEIKRLFA